MIVLGFDARERRCPRDRLWPDHRRALYLLRPEVDRPLSADVLVWPSVFEDPQLDVLGLQDLRIGSGGVPAPDMRGWVQGLWSDLGALRRSLDHTCNDTFDVIAVTSPRPWHFDVPASSPARREDTWEPLGYDVVDGWLLSGLGNCGYQSAAEIAAWRDAWAGHLNEHHLFDDPAQADRFAATTARRVREHAPFYACGLWRVH